MVQFKDVNNSCITFPVRALSLSTERNCGGPEIANTLWINASVTAHDVLSFVGIANTKFVCSHVTITINLKSSKPSGIYLISTARCSRGE